MSKEKNEVPKDDMETIAQNLQHCDHNDLCSIDQILTREKNKTETRIQWGSLVLGNKWVIE